MARGTHTMSLNSLRTAGGQPSGPGDFSTLSNFNFSNTDCTEDISISKISCIELIKVKNGRDVVSSEINTLEKNSTKCLSFEIIRGNFVTVGVMNVLYFSPGF